MRERDRETEEINSWKKSVLMLCVLFNSDSSLLPHLTSFIAHLSQVIVKPGDPRGTLTFPVAWGVMPVPPLHNIRLPSVWLLLNEQEIFFCWISDWVTYDGTGWSSISGKWADHWEINWDQMGKLVYGNYCISNHANWHLSLGEFPIYSSFSLFTFNGGISCYY